MANQTVEVVDRLDKDNDGVITLDEFQGAMRENPALFNTFGRIFGVDPVNPHNALALDPKGTALARTPLHPFACSHYWSWRCR